jgi:GNAT superfamily N-acetyltransferase
MVSSQLNIRFATENDVSTIYKLICELAEFEKLSHQVTATEEGLRKSLFNSNHKKAEVLLAETEEIAVGFALFFFNYSTFLGKAGVYLEDLYVTPAHRSKGYGERILSHIAKIAVDQDCGRFEWSVLDWNKNAIRFYRKLGAEPLNEWTQFRLAGQNLINLAEKF